MDYTQICYIGNQLMMHRYHFLVADPILILFRWKMANTDTDTDTLICKHHLQEIVGNLNTILRASF